MWEGAGNRIVRRFLIVRPGGKDGGSIRLAAKLPRSLSPNEFAFELEIAMPDSFFRKVFKQRLEIPEELAGRIPTLMYQLRDNQGRFVEKEQEKPRVS